MAETIGAVIIMGAFTLFCFVIVALLVKTHKEMRS